MYSCKLFGSHPRNHDHAWDFQSFFICFGNKVYETDYSLQNPKNFRTCESFKFSNARFFYPY